MPAKDLVVCVRSRAAALTVLRSEVLKVPCREPQWRGRCGRRHTAGKKAESRGKGGAVAERGHASYLLCKRHNAQALDGTLDAARHLFGCFHPYWRFFGKDVQSTAAVGNAPEAERFPKAITSIWQLTGSLRSRPHAWRVCTNACALRGSWRTVGAPRFQVLPAASTDPAFFC